MKEVSKNKTKGQTKGQTKAKATEKIAKSLKDLRTEKVEKLEKLFNTYSTKAVNFDELVVNEKYVMIVGLEKGILQCINSKLKSSFTFGNYDYVVYRGFGEFEKAFYFNVIDTVGQVEFDNFIRTEYIEKTADVDKGILVKLRADEHKTHCNLYGFMNLNTWQAYTKDVDKVISDFNKQVEKQKTEKAEKAEKAGKKAVKSK